MYEFWTGPSVLLRGIEPSDAEHFHRWNGDTEAVRFMDFVWPPIWTSQVSAWAAEQSQKKLQNDQFHWVIESRSGTVVGTIDTHECQPRNGKFSYGLHVDRMHRRNGYATEAIGIVLRYYFRELRYQKVTVGVQSNNPASIHLHESIGFQQEGVHRRMVYRDGSLHDMVYFGMMDTEFPDAAAFPSSIRGQ